MSRVFDTGTQLPMRTLIKDGVLKILSPLLRSNGGYLRSLELIGSVARSWTDELGIDMILQALSGTPAIGIALGTRQFQTLNIQKSEFSGELELILYFVNQHGRDMQRGRIAPDRVADMDGRADPGIEVMMEHSLELLLGQYPTELSGVIKQIIPDREQEITTIPELTLWTLVCQVKTFALRPAGGNARQWRTAPELLQSIAWRITRDAADPQRPEPAVSSTAIDMDSNTDT